MKHSDRVDRDTEFSVRRVRDDWDRYYYTCTACDRSAPAVSQLPHTDGCPVESPDTVSLPVSESSQEQIRGLVESVAGMFRYDEVETSAEAEDRIAEHDGVRWTASGSTSRFVVSLGRTSIRGDFHREERRPLVLKFDPFVRFEEGTTPSSGNIDELFTWQTAGETGTRLFFAEIFGAARDGMWILMEECIPVYPRHRSVMRERDAIWDTDRDQYIDPLRGALRAHGWTNPDWKHGNIGLSEAGRAVMVDYGTGPSFDPGAVERDRVFEQVVERAGGTFPPDE